MNAKVLLRHAMNQMRTTWLMSGNRFVSPYDIQAKNPALTLSFAALVTGYLVLGLYDYHYFPRDVFGGYVEDGVSRVSYVAAFQLAYWIGTVLACLMLFSLAIPLEYSSRFWQGLIALNWWSVMVIPLIFPLLVLLLTINEDDAFYSPALAVLVVVLIVVLWKSINLLKHSLKTGYDVAIFLVAAITGMQTLSAYLVLSAAGIRLF